MLHPLGLLALGFLLAMQCVKLGESIGKGDRKDAIFWLVLLLVSAGWAWHQVSLFEVR